MAGFIQNILWNSVEGFVEAGTRSAGEYAGNALIKAGDMIEIGGRGVGNSIEKKATNYGSSISGQTYQPSPKALPSTACKPVVKRSNSLPASSRLAASGTKAINSTPLGGKKYPGTNQVNGNGSKKAITGGIGRAKSTTSSVTNGARKAIGGVSNNVVGSGQKGQKALTGLPSSGGPKTAVKPGASKPFVPPIEQQKGTGSKPKANPKPYPGTNTLPGQASKTPITAQKKLKPLPRLGPQVGAGQKMQHISV